MKKTAILLSLGLSLAVLAQPILQMNKAFLALSDLIPYITDHDKFMNKKNDAFIVSKMTDLSTAFKNAKHDVVIKEDIFAPSYNLINENLTGTLAAFKAGKKDYAHWRIKEVTSLCLDCHTRMPASHASSFQNGELTIDEKKFEDVYNLGIAQLIVRRYVDAKNSFNRSIEDKLIKKDTTNLILPFKQLLLIDTKVLKNPKNLEAEFTSYLMHKNLPEEVKNELKAWISRLNHWKDNKLLASGLKTDTDVSNFIKNELGPLKVDDMKEGSDVDLLFASGLLSNYLYENPTTPKAPEIGYWIGWAEKYLKRENFFGPGDLFLKQCIRKYPTHPIAPKCFEEYRENVTFEFSGSSGTHIPADVQKELNDLKKLLPKK